MCQIKTFGGQSVDLSKLDLVELKRLHWEQERAFAKKLHGMAVRSSERSELISQAYSAVSSIIEEMNGRRGQSNLSAGFAEKHADVLRSVLRKEKSKSSGKPTFFEVGFGNGHALELAAREGFVPMGIEIGAKFVDSASKKFSMNESRFFCGEVLDLDLADLHDQVDVVYWNDVMEHIPPDEIPDILAVIWSVLRPGGVLVTITPNWHVRPSDITNAFKPPRTEAEGFHLKEYRLAEVVELLKAAEFKKIATPLLATRKKAVIFGSGAASLKRLFEPLLEYMPFPCARVLTSIFALSITIAVKP